MRERLLNVQQELLRIWVRRRRAPLNEAHGLIIRLAPLGLPRVTSRPLVGSGCAPLNLPVAREYTAKAARARMQSDSD